MINKLFSLENKVVVVTGALGLLGKNFCTALAEAGASVVVCDLYENECTDFADLLGKKNLGIAADITNNLSVKNLRDKVLEKFGKIDVLVNNAAINEKFEDPVYAAENTKFENYPQDLWQRSLDINITGTFLCSQILGTEMAKANSGSIINIASTYGIVAPDQSLYENNEGKQKFYKTAAYPVTKGAIISFTRFLAAYWGKKAVRVNSLSPGGVENNQEEFFVKKYSERTPLKRMATATDYNGAIVFLASDASCYMTGTNLIIDGGWTIW